MSDVELTNKTVKCRKDHQCEWCGEIINAGDTARYRTGRFEDNFFSGYQHPECYTAMGLSDFDEWDGGFTPMSQMRGKTMDESHN